MIMRKITIPLLVLLLNSFNVTSANYFTESFENFINSPSVEELNSIEDANLKYCEQVFLEAYMRREFTEDENILCSDIFEEKIEDNLNYIKYVFRKRGIY